jgi:hypothetical protein
MSAVIGLVYLSIGVAISIWSRSSFDKDEEWLASLFIVSVAWLPLVALMGVVWLWWRMRGER